jgi:hypothetical protein
MIVKTHNVASSSSVYIIHSSQTQISRGSPAHTRHDSTWRLTPGRRRQVETRIKLFASIAAGLLLSIHLKSRNPALVNNPSVSRHVYHLARQEEE